MRARGIGSVRGIRDYYFFPGFVFVFKVRRHDEHAAKLSVRAGGRLERYGAHPAYLREGSFELAHEFQGSLRHVFIFVRVKRGKAGEPCRDLVYLRVVFHGAAAERVKDAVDSDVFLRECRVVPYAVHLAYFRTSVYLLAQKGLGNGLRGFYARHVRRGRKDSVSSLS